MQGLRPIQLCTLYECARCRVSLSMPVGALSVVESRRESPGQTLPCLSLTATFTSRGAPAARMPSLFRLLPNLAVLCHATGAPGETSSAWGPVGSLSWLVLLRMSMLYDPAGPDTCISSYRSVCHRQRHHRKSLKISVRTRRWALRRGLILSPCSSIWDAKRDSASALPHQKPQQQP